MEIAGVALGAAGLVGLWGTCLQLIDQIDTSRNVGIDSQPILARFDNCSQLLREWGLRVGMDIETGALTLNHAAALDDERTRKAIYHTLASLEKLLNDGEALTKKYGLRKGDSGSVNVITQAESQNMALRVQKELSFRRKGGWVLKDKSKFEKLVSSVGALVEQLFMMVQWNSRQSGWAENVQPRLDELRTSIDEQARLAVHHRQQDQLFQTEVSNFMSAMERENVLKWLEATSTEAELDEVKRKRQPGTCGWIFNRPAFEDWLSTSSTNSPRVLWLHGKPGAGKTFISARVIEYLCTSSAHPVAHFLCRNDDALKSDTISILRSWIVQLASQRVDALREVQRFREGRETRAPVYSEVWNIFRSIVRILRHCYLVVDGLDECLAHNRTARIHSERDDSREKFLRDLFVSLTGSSAKVLIVSRDEASIRAGLGLKDDSRKSLQQPPPVPSSLAQVIEYPINATDSREDIVAYTTNVVSTELGHKDPAFQSEITQLLTSRCDGMFLWVRLQETKLYRFGRFSEGRLREALSDGSATGLETTYERSWARILGLDAEERQYVLDLLRWVLFARSPLRVAELVDVLMLRYIKPGTNHYPLDQVPYRIDAAYLESRIIKPCESFLEARCRRMDRKLELRSYTVHTVHFSAKEFLLGKVEYFSPNQSHGILARTCLRYLMLDDFDATTVLRTALDPYGRPDGPKNLELVGEALMELRKRTGSVVKVEIDPASPGPDHIAFSHALYASMDWQTHAASSGEDPETLAAMKRFIPAQPSHLPRHGCYMSWSMLLYTSESRLADVAGNNPFWHAFLPENVVSPLWFAAQSGLMCLASYLLQCGADPNSVGYNAWRNPALYSATLKGNLEMVKLLLDHGAQVLKPNSRGFSALQAGAVAGSVDLMDMLIDRLPDRSALYDHRGTHALVWAAVNNNRDIVRLLLQKGVNVNIVVKETEPAQPSKRKPEVETFHTALASACSVEVAEELLNYGADINGYILPANCRDTATGSLFPKQTPLVTASESGHVEVVEFLLKRGADVNLARFDGKTALDAAVFKGHLRIVELLISHGKNAIGQGLGTMPGYFCGVRGQPLTLAASGNNREVLEVLVQRYGANINERDPKTGNTPLGAACGWVEGVELLLRWGAAVDICDNRGDTPLVKAAAAGHAQVVSLLCQYGADRSRLHLGLISLVAQAVAGFEPPFCCDNLKQGLYGWKYVSSKSEFVALPSSSDDGQNKTYVLDKSKFKPWGHDCDALSEQGCHCNWKLSEYLEHYLRLGANPNGIDPDSGHTALTMLVANGFCDCESNFLKSMQLMVSFGADPNAANVFSGKTALMYACTDVYKSEFVRLLLQLGANPNAAPSKAHGKTALMYACMSGSLEVADMLVAWGASEEVRDREGRTARMMIGFGEQREYCCRYCGRAALFLED